MRTQIINQLSRRLAKKGKKPNGFTLVELMVVIVIVGILSAVGAPQLLKAQDAAKNSVAKSTVVNQAKECSAALVVGDASGFTGATNSSIVYTAPTCADDAEFEASGKTETWTVTLTDGFPAAPVETPYSG